MNSPLDCHVGGIFWTYLGYYLGTNLFQQFWLERRWLCRIPSAGFDKTALCRQKSTFISVSDLGDCGHPSYKPKVQTGSRVTYGLFLLFSLAIVFFFVTILFY